MKETEAVEALAEYVVFQEYPTEARVAWLKACINAALRGPSDKLVLATIGFINQVSWCTLLEPDTKKTLEEAAQHR